MKGSFAGCTPKRTRARSRRPRTTGLRAQSAATKKRSKRKIRQLWGHGNGNFRTGGKRSAATVRGTWWLVTDRCDGTLTRVKVGRVDVRDFRLQQDDQAAGGQAAPDLPRQGALRAAKKRAAACATAQWFRNLS